MDNWQTGNQVSGQMADGQWPTDNVLTINLANAHISPKRYFTERTFGRTEIWPNGRTIFTLNKFNINFIFFIRFFT